MSSFSDLSKIKVGSESYSEKHNANKKFYEDALKVGHRVFAASFTDSKMRM
jgi:hypothetical protein